MLKRLVRYTLWTRQGTDVPTLVSDEENDVCSSLPRSLSAEASNSSIRGVTKDRGADNFDIYCVWCFDHKNVSVLMRYD